MLERNERLWEGVGLIFSAIELQRAVCATRFDNYADVWPRRVWL